MSLDSISRLYARGVARRLLPDQRRAQLLDVALELAAGGDLAAVPVATLAAAAGVSEGLLYHYFPTKQSLTVAALRRAADALVADLDAATGDDPASRLAAGLRAYLDHVEAQPVGWLALLRASSGELAEIAAEVERHSVAVALDVLGVVDPGPALSVALTGWLAFERTACAAWLDHRDLDRAALEDVLLATFVAALSTAAHHDPTAAAAVRRLGMS